MGILSNLIETLLDLAGFVDADVAAKESSSVYSSPEERRSESTDPVIMTPIRTDRINASTIQVTTNPQRPLDNVTTIYLRSPGAGQEVYESRVTYDSWWRPQCVFGPDDCFSVKLKSDGTENTFGMIWRIKDGPPVHFPSEEDLAEFFPPDHPERQKR